MDVLDIGTFSMNEKDGWKRCVYLYITYIFMNGWDQKWTFQIPDPVFTSLLRVCVFRKDAAKVWKNAAHQICFCQTALNLGWPSVGNSTERKTEGICFIKPSTKKCGLKARVVVSGVRHLSKSKQFLCCFDAPCLQESSSNNTNILFIFFNQNGIGVLSLLCMQQNTVNDGVTSLELVQTWCHFPAKLRQKVIFFFFFLQSFIMAMLCLFYGCSNKKMREADCRTPEENPSPTFVCSWEEQSRLRTKRTRFCGLFM